LSAELRGQTADLERLQIAPSVFAMTALEKGTNEAFGEHCMEFFMPEFRQQVKEGANVVVAGDAFGCGSSRETAVTSLLGESQIQALMLFTHALYPSHLRPVFEPA
jgi:3-isopropylmalate dehydratase small subunit